MWRLTLVVLAGIINFGSSAPTYFNKRLEEAEQIALESTGLLQPHDAVVRRIMSDLKAIRDEFPEIQGVIHRKKWIPGELVIQKVTDDQINEIDDSRIFGPLQQVRKVRSGASSPSVLIFSNAYNPERMVENIYKKFGVRAEPNTNYDILGANGSIAYNPQTGNILIEQKPKHGGYAGFRNKFVWEFNVKNRRANLLRSVKPGFEFSG